MSAINYFYATESNLALFSFEFLLFFMKNRSGGGNISACGGNGFAGGGGGRVSVHVFSRHDDPKFFVHGKISQTKSLFTSFDMGMFRRPSTVIMPNN